MQPLAPCWRPPRRAILTLPLALGLAGMSTAALTRQDEGDTTTMEMAIEHLSPEGMHRNPAFSQAVVVTNPGRTIYIGGQNAVNAQGEIVGKGDLAAQTEQIFVNLGIVLEAAGASLHDIVKWTMFLVDGQDLRPGFEVFQRHSYTEANTIRLVVHPGGLLTHPKDIAA